jgi:nucleotide-binding universal stress UspA family protein
MFKKIVIATDLSDSSKALINCLKDFKSLGVEEIILFYACGITHLAPLADDIKQSVEPDLKIQQKLIEEQGFKTTLEIVPGIPSEELKFLVKEKNVSLIVVGSHGESAFTHQLFRFGGTTSEILHSHEKPLLMVRTFVSEQKGTKIVETACQSLKERILFPTDFSDISMRAFQYVERLVEDGCKKVTLLHIQDKVKIDKYLSDKLNEFNRIDADRLEMRKNQLIAKGAIEVETKIAYGIPTEEILAESHNGYSLIVMGSQGRGFFREIFIGSVSHNIARLSNTSVLLIPMENR